MREGFPGSHEFYHGETLESGAEVSQWVDRAWAAGLLHRVWRLRHHLGTVPSPTERLVHGRGPFSRLSAIPVKDSGHTTPFTQLVPPKQNRRGFPFDLRSLISTTSKETSSTLNSGFCQVHFVGQSLRGTKCGSPLEPGGFYSNEAH